MRVPSGKIPAQPLSYMWERHYEILRRLVAGDRQCDIAGSLGMTDTRLSIIVNSPIFQARLLELRERANAGAANVMGRISKLAIDSMTILENAIRAKRGEAGYDPELRTVEKIRCAQDVLDRAGYSAVQKSVALTGVLTSEDIEELKRRKNMRVVSTQQIEYKEEQAPAGVAFASSFGLP
jgi:hypothetical protein